MPTFTPHDQPTALSCLDRLVDVFDLSLMSWQEFRTGGKLRLWRGQWPREVGLSLCAERPPEAAPAALLLPPMKLVLFGPRILGNGL